jgi:beta-lactam-binding protein with PASTA domain
MKGLTRDEAVARLRDANLVPNVHEVPSNEPEDTVIAQDPRAGTRVDEETKVRINVSSGPRTVGVPNVVGQSYESAASFLQGQGFAVARRDQESDRPANTVIAQNPTANSFVAEGTVITLTVSKGPKDKAVPPVEGLDVESAQAALEDAGFKVRIEYMDTEDQSLDQTVLAQDPASGTRAKPGSTVTVTVGRLTPPTTTAPPP